MIIKFFYLLLIIPVILTGCGTKTEESFKDDNPRYFYQLGWDESVWLEGRYLAAEEACKKQNCYRFTYDDLDRVALIEYFENNELKADDFLGVATVKLTYGTLGFARRFYDTDKNKATDYDGVHAEILQFRPDLNVWIKQQEGADRKLVKNTRGVYGYIEILNKDGVKIESQPLDENFKLTTDDNGVAKKVFVRNLDGFVVETRNYDRNGDLFGSLKDGVAITKKTVNSMGDVTRVEFFDAQENLIDTAEWKYDERGNEVK